MAGNAKDDEDSGEAEPGPSSTAAAAATTSERVKRSYVKWSYNEEAVFFATLERVKGQKPETCFNEISVAIATKDYNQVGVPGRSRWSCCCLQQ